MNISDRLVADWRSAWRWWSVRMAAVAGLAVTFIVAAPETFLGVLNSLPADMREKLSPVIGIAVAVLVTLTRLWKQKPKTPTDGE